MMNGLAERIKIDSLAYWKYQKHHLLGAIECWDADVVSVSRSLMITETEVKTSIKDLRQDIKKRYKHWTFKNNIENLHRPVHYFYFILPAKLKDESLVIISEYYPYAGLLIWEDGERDIHKNQGITQILKPQRFKQPKITLKDLQRIGYIASNNIIHYANLLGRGKVL